MTDDQIMALFDQANKPVIVTTAHAEWHQAILVRFARAVLAEAEAAQTIKIERGFMGTVARAALEECAAEAPPACAEFISAYIDKHYP